MNHPRPSAPRRYLHIYDTIQLAIEYRGARPEHYKRRNTVKATLTSRSMVWSGITCRRDSGRRCSFFASISGGRFCGASSVNNFWLSPASPHEGGTSSNPRWLCGILARWIASRPSRPTVIPVNAPDAELLRWFPRRPDFYPVRLNRQSDIKENVVSTNVYILLHHGFKISCDQ